MLPNGIYIYKPRSTMRYCYRDGKEHIIEVTPQGKFRVIKSDYMPPTGWLPQIMKEQLERRYISLTIKSYLKKVYGKK